MLRPSLLASPRALWESFIRPLTAILDLVRRDKMNAADIPIAQATATVAHYVNQFPTPPLDDVGEFASVVSSMLLVKSGGLTPWLQPQEAETDEHYSRATRRRDFDSYKPGLVYLTDRLAEGLECFSRFDHVAGLSRLEVDTPLAAATLASAYTATLRDIDVRNRARISPSLFLRVDMAIRSVQESLRQLRTFTFNAFIRNQRLDRRGAVVYFLAILDLARKGAVNVQQDAPFQDIHLDRTAVAISGVE